MNLERNTPTWYSSSLFLLAGLASLQALRRTETRQTRVAWLGVASLSLAFSLDETASLHEMASRGLGAELTLSLTQPLSALIVAVGLLGVSRLVATEAKPVLYLAVAALVLSQTSASVGGLLVTGLTRRTLETAEETLEMTVGLLLLVAALRGAGFIVTTQWSRIRQEWASS